ncbi:uncharacterized protein LOC111629076 isoform X2 [Centruroides sculpturatus]|uniref:uncharacterized protein LOC111629076 isoform X2 n=1 Tax=Centruroides sculpturatus TaxID=218467 RepID=UPI000C6EB9E9|nr:uncharacterized protein LOC111629076 isoform X2 [Centruroides sculpturatus]
MSICRSSPFSSRTKSLRERFGSKRSYSESFKDPPTTTARKDTTGVRPSCPVPLPESGRQASTGSIRITEIPPDHFNPFAVLPEETYCSALDINCQQGDPRFPWQRDVAVQCDLSPADSGITISTRNGRKNSTKKDSILSQITSDLTSRSIGSSISSLTGSQRSMKIASTIDETLAANKKVQPKKKTSMLQRAMSLERGRSRQKLVHQVSVDESRVDQMYVPHHVQTLSTNPEVTVVAEDEETPIITKNVTPPSDTPPHTPPATLPLTRKPSVSDRRKMCFMRQQTNSAPDSFDENMPQDNPDKSTVGYFNFDSMQRLLDLSITAAASQTGKLDNRTFLLSIPTPAGLATRDGKEGPAYLNLPSPNLQNEEQESSNVFKKLSSCEDEESEQEEVEEGPPVSALHRRRALVPPKMLTDGYESANEELEQPSENLGPNNTADALNRSRRRSSIVVIPPMQICPGDLLVYSKVLTHRNTLLDLDGSTQCLAVSEDSTRKNKNTWSLLRLFDRSNRSKSESLCGLEEVLSSLQPSEFVDEQLSKYKGMQWSDFVTLCEEKRQQRLDSVQLPTTSSWLTFTDDSSDRSPTDSQRLSRSSVSSSVISERSQDYSTSDRSNSQDQQTSQTLDEIENQINSWWSHTVTKHETKRKEALWDLFQSECMFLYDHLMVLKNVFMEPLKKIQVEGFAMFAEPEVLFGNLDELCCVTYAFCKEFLSLILQRMNTGEVDTTEVLVKLFRKSSKATALTQAYHRYTLNYINALNYLETLRRQVEFNEFEKWCSRDSRCKKLQLTDLLVSPVQHIMRVPLILKEIEMRTENSDEQKIIASILEAEEHSLRELDDKMKWLKNFERLLEIQRNIVWPSVTELDPKAFIPEFLRGPLAKQPCERLIVSPRRQIILEGCLQLLDSGKPIEMFVILFDDMLLITRRKKGLHKKKSSITENWASSCSRGSSSVHEGGFKYVVYKQPLSLDRFFIHDVGPQDCCATNLKNAFVLVCLNRFQQIVTVHTFQGANETIKSTWLSKLRDTMDRWKRTLQNTVFRNQRIANTAVK